MDFLGSQDDARQKFKIVQKCLEINFLNLILTILCIVCSLNKQKMSGNIILLNLREGVLRVIHGSHSL
jgi:hypothetical protein